jgi:hypothetical protein
MNRPPSLSDLGLSYPCTCGYEDPERVVWACASEYSNLNWRVYLDRGQPRVLASGPDDVEQ